MRLNLRSAPESGLSQLRIGVARTGTPPRFEELDCLRGIAAIWVVVFHLTFGLRHFWLRDQPDLAAAITPFAFNIEGMKAVDLFFVISGYVICMTVERSATVPDFLVSRFARLFPVFWFGVAIATAAGVLVPSSRLPVTLGQGLVNLSMFHDYIGVPAVDPSFWSLSVELGFYGLMTAIMLTRQQRHLEIIGLVWMLIGFACTHLLPEADFVIPWRISIGLALAHAGLFYAGILFYRIRTDRFTWLRAAAIALCLLLRIAVASPVTAVLDCAIFGTFALCVAGKLSALRVRPLMYLGAISYSLYVLHQPLAFRLQLGFHALGATPWLNFAATLGVLLAVSAVLTNAVERPAGRFIRGRYAARRCFGARLQQQGPPA